MRGAIWVLCPDQCGDYYCRRHNKHVSACACPPLDDWHAVGTSPYGDLPW